MRLEAGRVGQGDRRCRRLTGGEDGVVGPPDQGGGQGGQWPADLGGDGAVPTGAVVHHERAGERPGQRLGQAQRDPRRAASRARAPGSAVTHRPRSRTTARLASASACTSSPVSTSPPTDGLPAEASGAARGRSPTAPADAGAGVCDERLQVEASPAGHRRATAPRSPAAVRSSAVGPSRAAASSSSSSSASGRAWASARSSGGHTRAPRRRARSRSASASAPETGEHRGRRLPQLGGVDHQRRVGVAAQLQGHHDGVLVVVVGQVEAQHGTGALAPQTRASRWPASQRRRATDGGPRRA